MATTVLVVEDDLEINELLGEYLALESIRYVKATSGKEGIHLAQTTHPDAIILDLMLPDIDGFEVVRTISSHRTTYDIPVIILSCLCDVCDKEKGIGSGALSFMNKPFLPDDLLAAVRNALAWKAELKKRPPSQVIALEKSPKDPVLCNKAINQMMADLFSHTDLSDAGIAGIREGVEMLAGWAAKWNSEHPQPSHVTLEYRIKPKGAELRNGSTPMIEWILREDAPGMLADAFFKPAAAATGIGGLIGWGGNGAQSKAPAMPPATWLQVLSKTGAVSFEKDAAAHSVRFSRLSGGALNAAPSGPMQLNGTR